MIKYHSQTPTGSESTGGGWGRMEQEEQQRRERRFSPPALSRKIYDFLFCTQTKTAQCTFPHTSVMDTMWAGLGNRSSLPFPAQWDRRGPARAAPASPRRPIRIHTGPPRHYYYIVPEDASGRQTERMHFKHCVKRGKSLYLQCLNDENIIALTCLDTYSSICLQHSNALAVLIT